MGTLLLSVPLVLEYESICMLAEHRIVRGRSVAEIEAFLGFLIHIAEPVAIYFRWRPQLRDVGDEMVLEAAVNGRADFLVTFNSRDFGIVPEGFGIKVLPPSEILRKMRILKQ